MPGRGVGGGEVSVEKREGGALVQGGAGAGGTRGQECVLGGGRDLFWGGPKFPPLQGINRERFTESTKIARFVAIFCNF